MVFTCLIISPPERLQLDAPSMVTAPMTKRAAQPLTRANHYSEAASVLAVRIYLDQEAKFGCYRPVGGRFAFEGLDEPCGGGKHPAFCNHLRIANQDIRVPFRSAGGNEANVYGVQNSRASRPTHVHTQRTAWDTLLDIVETHIACWRLTTQPLTEGRIFSRLLQVIRT